MTKIVKAIGTYLLVGTATAAGATLWNEVLKDKTFEVANNLKKKKEQNQKIIKFEKRV